MTAFSRVGHAEASAVQDNKLDLNSQAQSSVLPQFRYGP